VITEWFRNYYNLIRPHQALDGQTPAEAAKIGLNLNGKRWLSLIRQAKQGRPRVNQQNPPESVADRTRQ